MTAHFIDSNYFDHDNSLDTLDIETFKQMYTEMKYSAYDTLPFEPIDTIMWRTYQYRPDTINLLFMRYDYYELKPDAMTTNTYFDFDTVNNTLSDKVIRPDYPYDIKRIFVVSPNKHIITKRKVTYKLDAANFFKDEFNGFGYTGETNPHLIEVNFNDGSGWHTIPTGMNTHITITYPNTSGVFLIEARIKYNGNIVDYSKSFIKKKATREDPFDDPDVVMNMFNMQINVYNPCSMQPEHMKTLVYLEGFDILDFLPNMLRTADDIYITQVRNSGISDLRNFGYRIFVVDWVNSRQAIQNNAENLINLINFINCDNLANNCNEETVIIGESMGGLIAKYALMKIEQDGIKDGCAREHRVRLLLTLDTPHDGAHVPMSIQLVYRYFRNHFPFGFISGLPSSFLSNSIGLTAFDMFLECDAAKQMLIDHVSTQSLLGPWTFHEHNMRDQLVNEFITMGGRPQFCKVVAASNGNMAGLDQTRYWDGNPRTPGDRLFNARSEIFVRFLGVRLPIVGFDLKMNTDPNGIGNLGSLNYGTWFIKLKLKWFGIKIYTDYNSLCNKDWHGNMVPISTSSGGLLEYNNEIRANVLDNFPYTGQGNWETNTNNSLTRMQTDGFAWCFVPTASALNFGPALNVNFDGIPTAAVLNNDPFDVIYGIDGSLQAFVPQDINPLDFNENTYIRNQYHLNVRNDSLTDANQFPVELFYNDPVNNPNCENPMIRMVNREIGDNEIVVDNRTLDWNASLSIHEKITVNDYVRHYTYANYQDLTYTKRSVYSKENPLIINSPAVYDFFVNNNPATDIIYNAPFTGPYNASTFSILPCCNAYLAPNKFNHGEKHSIKVYPNPLMSNQLNVDFDTNITGQVKYSFFNSIGVKVNSNILKLDNSNTLRIIRPNELSSGIYFLKIETPTDKHNFKIQINN